MDNKKGAVNMEDMKTLATQGIEPNGGALSSENVSKLGSNGVSKISKL